MKKLSRDQTFMLITVPVLVLFFCFNTLPLIKGLRSEERRVGKECG